MHDLFAAIPRELRHAKLAEYNRYLIERDGEMNLKEHTLSRREKTVKRYESKPAVTREMDEDAFRRHYRQYDTRNPPSDEMKLLLALTKVNAAEAWGVSRTIQQAEAAALASNDDTELRILCEETYHTRILVSSANHYGIVIKDTYDPPSALRILIGGIANTPKSLSRPMVMAGEVIGTVLFLNMIEVTRRVLKHDSQTRDAIEERLCEITADERGHISYNRLLSGAAALAQTRLILPVVARALKTVMPEAIELGAYPTNLWASLAQLADTKRLPEAVRKQSFIA